MTRGRCAPPPAPPVPVRVKLAGVEKVLVTEAGGWVPRAGAGTHSAAKSHKKDVAAENAELRGKLDVAGAKVRAPPARRRPPGPQLLLPRL